MLKILEALAMFWIGHMSKNEHSHHPATVPGLGIEFVMSKSREFALLSMAGIILAILFAGGILLGLVGMSFWIADSANPELSHILVYSGVGLTVFCGAVGSFVFSKKRFNIVVPRKKIIASIE